MTTSGAHSVTTDLQGQPYIQSVAAAQPSPTLSGESYLDYWIVGGASIVAWVLLTLLVPLRNESWAINLHIANIPALMGSLSLLVNYPHFMASYKLSYGLGPSFIKAHAFQLIVVPILLVAVLAVAWFCYSSLEFNSFFTQSSLYAAMGGTGMLGGQWILGTLTKIMFFTVGWHYSKQWFGILMIQAKFDSYPLASWQRHIAKAALFSVWFINYFSFSTSGTPRQYREVHYTDWNIPKVFLWDMDLMQMLLRGFLGISCLGFLFGIVLYNGRKLNKWPTARFTMPLLAFGLWWLPALIQNDFYMYMVPFFHSLQYLLFVRKVEHTELASASRPGLSKTLLVAGLLISGYLSFELVPSLLDRKDVVTSIAGISFFAVAFTLFINVHHYFIDNVLWRMRTSPVAKRLFQ
jgi:hypothetical protein